MDIHNRHWITVGLSIAVMMTLVFSLKPISAIEDQTPTHFGISAGDVYTWKTVYYSAGEVDDSYYDRWTILQITSTAIYARLENGISLDAFYLWETNALVVEIYDGTSGFFAGLAGPWIVPIPVNVTALVELSSFTFTNFNYWGENITWAWDGHNLFVNDTYYPDIGDPIVDLRLKWQYNDAGVLIAGEQTYYSNGILNRVTKELISIGQVSEVPAATPTVISLPSSNNILTTLSLETNSVVNLTLATLQEPPLNTPLTGSILYLEINCSNQDNVNFPIELTFSYSDASLAAQGLSATDLAVWYLNSEGTWEQLSTKLDTEAKIFTVELTHFSFYALGPGTSTIVHEVEVPTSTIDGYPLFTLVSMISLALAILFEWKRRAKK